MVRPCRQGLPSGSPATRWVQVTDVRNEFSSRRHVFSHATRRESPARLTLYQAARKSAVASIFRSISVERAAEDQERRDEDRYPKNAGRVTKGAAEAEAHAASLCEARWFVILACLRLAPPRDGDLSRTPPERKAHRDRKVGLMRGEPP